MDGSYPVTKRNKVRRLHERGRYDRDSVHAILDAAMLCHIAYVIEGQPYCTPCPRLPPGVAFPDGLRGFVAGRRLDEVMAENAG